MTKSELARINSLETQFQFSKIERFSGFLTS
jgi:hypothetical protein